ncbi:C2 domain-containing protein 3-like [Actinia tenebrosa]|uniref:C2 domain-containing protein 3-like n=1 Tax=Actinia tenebrosa TaxID=6105 RepID=A0A6P8I894_ACTTE|nr:C2 domain-containing protein 3-like [Actinia tenebrosa]
MKRKGKAGKKSKPVLKRKDSVSSEDEQVSVSTSLPPSVEGQIRCFLTVSVSKFTWTVEKHPDGVSIRIRWWGEQGEGALLRPLIKGQAKLNVKSRWTSVRYPVCSGPKQFAAYLNDMGSLVVETVHTSTQIPFGKALISEITQLTASHPVNVVVPVMSVISPFGKVADVQVFIKFESVSAAYNKLSSTIPTVDTGLDKQVVDRSSSHPTPPPYLNPATPVIHPKHQTDIKDPFESPAPAKGVKFSEDPPERLEYSLDPSLLSLLEHNGSSSQQLDTGSAINKEVTQTQLTSENEENLLNQNAGTMVASHEYSQHLQDNSMDWIGALLDKGQRLREGLAMSTLLDDTNVTDQYSPQETHVLPGSLFQEILSSNKTGIHRGQPDAVIHPVLDHSDGQVVGDDNTVVDLLMGDRHQGVDLIEHSSYLSDLSEDMSELGDPLHDDSLLMDLFYKQQGDKSAGSDTDITISTDDDEQESSPVNIAAEKNDDEEIRVKQYKNRKDKSRKGDESSEEDLDTQRRIETPAEMRNTDDIAHELGVDTEDIDGTLYSQQRTGVPAPALPHLRNSDDKDLENTLHSRQRTDDMVHKLGTDTLTTLGRVNTARVIVERLLITDNSTLENQMSSRKPSTFFVEYDFPVNAKDVTGNVSLVKELTRVASKKLHNKAVIFNHRSVFPVSFNASVLEHWWGLGLTFRILKRESGQRMPEEFGVGFLPLKTVLLSNTLSLASFVEVNNKKVKSDPASLSWQQSLAEDSHSGITGKLEVKVDVGLDGKQLQCQKSTDTAYLPQQTQSNVGIVSKAVAAASTTDKHDVVTSKPPLPRQLQHQVRESVELEDQIETITLHSLLWIPEGKEITPEPPGNSGRSANLFLVSRMFWCDEVSKSPIYWGTNNPQFVYKQVAPVLLTPTLLQRTCNNFMVIEVWNKVIPQGEKLVGISKIPLHQFYLSFRDPKITKTLIKSKFPVVCIDGLVPVINPFTTHSHGELKVLLAMGTEEQITSLLEIKGCVQVPSGMHIIKETHHLDKPREINQTNLNHRITGNTSVVDHQFEITVEDIRGLSIFKSTVWGETDCYVQYHFPSQIQQSTDDLDHEVVPGLKTHHTCTTLCVPDPSFQDTTRHSFELPTGIPVQRYLLAAYSGSWTSMSSIPRSGGISFELWRRFYYPNVRDQLVAKANLPVAKLCAMVTMKRHREPSVQTFSLPLTVLPQEDKGSKQTVIEDSGLLDVTIRYRANKIQTIADKPTLDQVCLSVDIIRICGLKGAAKSLVHNLPSMLYPSDVGVNAYVVIKLPIGKKKRVVTRTVARTFAPEFFHHIEIATPLQMSRKSCDVNKQDHGEIISLAEMLEMSEAVFEVWHQDSRGFGNIDQQHHDDHHHHPTKPNKYDILLGVVIVPLTDLLTHRTGIRGWHAIQHEEMFVDEDHHGNSTVLGGLQLSIKFDDPQDRESLIHVGRSLGWSPPNGVEDADDEDVIFLDSKDDEDSDGDTPKGIALTVKMNRAWIPKTQSYQPKVEIKGYIRYKIYDKSPVCSRVVRIKQNKDDMLLLDIKHSKCFMLPATSSLVWYLKEEQLEVQVWLKGQSPNNKGTASLPGQRDKLIGSAFIKLSSLVTKGLHHPQTSFSGTFPLFKAGVDAVDGACVHVQISLAKPTASSHNYNKMGEHESLEDSISSEDYPSTKGYDDNDGESLKSNTDTTTAGRGDRNLVSETQPCKDDLNTFAAHIIVQEARHLNFGAAGPDSKRVSPNAYVTYQTSPSSLEVSTPVCKSSSSPVWEYQKLEKLPLSMLKTQNLIFKVWHKTNKDVSIGDVPLGFASVDLGPIAAGLRQLIGWYNIMDFNGKCKGQIKLGVVPLAPVSPSRCLPKSRINTGSLFSDINEGKRLVQDQQEQQVPIVQLPSDQEQAHLERSLESIGIQALPGKTEPVMPSTSGLFKQLRKNMEDLDELQTRLQTKLYTDSTTHRSSGVLYSSEENPSHKNILDRFTQEIASENMTDCDKEYQDTDQLLGTSEADNVSHVENPSSIPNRELESTSADKLVENSPQISHTLSKQNDTSSADIPLPPPMKDAGDAIFEGSSMDSVQHPSSSQDNDENIRISTLKETCENYSSASDLEEHVGSDSLEDGSNLPSAPVFTQERDSWLSSTEEEEETRKSPLNSNAYSLINSIMDQHAKEEFSSTMGQINPHSITEDTEITVTDKELSSPYSHKDTNGDDSNESLHYKCTDENSVYNVGNSIPPAQTHTYLSQSPNFFMPREQLEHSMRALRLNSRHSFAASDLKQGQSKLLQRTSEVSRNTGASETISQYSKKQVMYKAKKDGQPPLSSAEIERIARIFTLKDS